MKYIITKNRSELLQLKYVIAEEICLRMKSYPPADFKRDLSLFNRLVKCMLNETNFTVFNLTDLIEIEILLANRIRLLMLDVVMYRNTANHMIYELTLLRCKNYGRIYKRVLDLKFKDNPRWIVKSNIN